MELSVKYYRGFYILDILYTFTYLFKGSRQELKRNLLINLLIKIHS